SVHGREGFQRRRTRSQPTVGWLCVPSGYYREAVHRSHSPGSDQRPALSGGTLDSNDLIEQGQGRAGPFRRRSLMRYAIQTLWLDRLRYVPGILAVASSAVLIVCAVGILAGLLGTVSAPIDHSRAEIWVTSRDTLSCDTGMAIPTSLES